jgi:MFS family permease
VPGPVAEVRFRPKQIYGQSPSGVVGAIAIGLANGSFWSLAPLFTATRGFEPDQIAIFMSLAVIGGALLQYPLGRWSDHIDRRRVILLAALASVAVSIAMTAVPDQQATLLIALALPLGAFLFALYPLCVAHVNDHVSEDEFIEACSGMLLLYGGGSIIGPILAAVLMSWAGSDMLLVYISGIYALFSLFVVSRIQASPRPSSVDREDFVVMPSSATSGLDLDPRSSDLEIQENENSADGESPETSRS